MNYQNFNEHFWGPNGFEVIEKRLNQGSDSSKLFEIFMEDRSSIEESYAKGLKSLLKKTEAITEFGTLREGWLAVRGELENIIKIHTDLSSALLKDIAQPLRKFKDDQKKMRRQYLGDAWRLNKERLALDQNISRAKDRYEEYAKKAEIAHQQVEQAKVQNKSQSDIAKATAKAQKLAKEEMLFEHEYKEALSKLAQFQPVYEDKLSGIYQVLQQQEEERIEFLKAQLEKYVRSHEASAPYMGEACARMMQVVRAINKSEDIECFIRENRTGSDRPVVPQFVAYGKSSSYVYNTSSSSSPSSMSSDKASSFASSTSSSAKSSPAPAGGGGAKGGARKVRALYDYVGTDASELDFFADDIITLVQTDDSGWWTGELDGRKGLFPSNYVEQI